jgi:SAM-dependent methyltransferase
MVPTMLARRLVCPLCRGQLRFEPHVITCASCDAAFPQDQPGVVDLLPRDQQPAHDRWGGRQAEMESWYENLITDVGRAADCFANDYGPYAAVFATLHGTVVDVGGGNGVPRQYLPDDADYLSIDPSLCWLDADWTRLRDRFPRLAEQPPFVRGVGESLPLPDCSCDAVLSMWSLNHAADPARVIAEVHRVLRPGGRFLLVLEDMEPRWRDFAARGFRRRRWCELRAALRRKLACTLGLRSWPLQSDHCLILDSELLFWLRERFAVVRRGWPSPYLTYELRAR